MTGAPLPVDDVVASYFAAWNAEPDERADVVAAAFAPGSYYCDGAAEVTGHDQIVDMMSGVMEQFDGASFALASPIDTHHRQARFGWRMTGADGEVIVEGIDAMRFDDDGRISTTLGFFGVDLPEQAPEVEAGSAAS